MLSMVQELHTLDGDLFDNDIGAYLCSECVGYLWYSITEVAQFQSMLEE